MSINRPSGGADIIVEAPEARSPKSAAIIATLCLGGLTAALMQTLIIPIQPELHLLLDTTRDNASWVVTATLLAGAVAMPIAGRLGDLFGKRRVLLGSALILVVGSLVCAVSTTLIPMIIGRGIQGLAMGFIPVGISLVREVTPPRQTAMAISAMSATLGVGGAIGLPLSAWLAQTWDWHMLYWASLVLAGAVTLLVAAVVPRVADAGGGRFDGAGAIGLAAGLVTILLAVTKGNSWGWTSGTVLGLFAAGAIILIGWGFYELRHREPLVDLRSSARPAVLLTNLAAVAIGFGMMAQSITMPQILQMPIETGYGLNQSMLQAGLWMAPGGIMMMLCAPVSGLLINRLGAKTALVIGGIVLALGYLCATFLMNSPWQLMLASIIGAAGVGIGYGAMPTLIMASSPAAKAGAAVGLNALMRAIGTTTSAAVMAAVLAGMTIPGMAEIPSQDAFRWGFGIGALAALVGVGFTLLIPAQRHNTMPLRVRAGGRTG